MNCSICGATVNDMNVAVETGWIPGFWHHDGWCDPCCGECADQDVRYDEALGEYVRVEKGKVNL